MGNFNLRELDFIIENQMIIFRTKKVHHLKLKIYKICVKTLEKQKDKTGKLESTLTENFQTEIQKCERMGKIQKRALEICEMQLV